MISEKENEVVVTVSGVQVTTSCVFLENLLAHIPIDGTKIVAIKDLLVATKTEVWQDAMAWLNVAANFCTGKTLHWCKQGDFLKIRIRRQ